MAKLELDLNLHIEQFQSLFFLKIVSKLNAYSYSTDRKKVIRTGKKQKQNILRDIKNIINIIIFLKKD